MKKIAIVGASGHGKVVANIAKLNGYEEILFIDDDVSKKMCGRYFVRGTSQNIDKYRENYDFIVAIGNTKIRRMIQERLIKENYKVATLIHPNSVIGEDVIIGKGTVVMAGVIINSCSQIGKGCIVNTSSSIDHDCIIGDYVHVSVGAHIAGTVKIGNNTWIGAGATVSNNIEITGNCMIGAGAVVIHDLSDSGTYVGNLVRRVR